MAEINPHYLMKFGKLTNIENVDFSLPPDAKVTQITFDSFEKKDASTTIYIGCTGWGMKEWVGKVYPPKTQPKDFLHHYSRQFNTIEHNTTHYRIPDPTTVQKWRTESAVDFRFCPKIPQIISHRNDMGLGSGKLMEFCESIQGLEEKMGCCFMQLPPYFAPNRLLVLERFLEAFPNHIPLAVEFRHEDWFSNSSHWQAVTDILRKHNIAPVITDVAGRRDVLHMTLTNDTAMVRFVGNDFHPTDYSRIDAWSERLTTWIEKGVKNIYFFCHEPDNLLAPELCAYFFEKIKNIKGVRSRGPKFLASDDRQLSLF